MTRGGDTPFCWSAPSTPLRPSRETFRVQSLRLKPGLSGLGGAAAGPHPRGGGRPPPARARPGRSLAAPSAVAGFAHARVRPTRSLATQGLGAGGGSPEHPRRVSAGRPTLPHPCSRVPPLATPGPPAGRQPPLGRLPEGAAPPRTRRWFQTAAARAPSTLPSEAGWALL